MLYLFDALVYKFIFVHLVLQPRCCAREELDVVYLLTYLCQALFLGVDLEWGGFEKF